MSICTPCLQALPLASCAGVLTVGTIDLTAQSVNVYIRDVTTGQIMQLEGDADADGLVTVDLTEKKFFENHSYELWVTDTGADMMAKEDFAFGYEIFDTICLTFEYVQTVEGEPVQFVAQTVTEA